MTKLTVTQVRLRAARLKMNRLRERYAALRKDLGSLNTCIALYEKRFPDKATYTRETRSIVQSEMNHVRSECIKTMKVVCEQLGMAWKRPQKRAVAKPYRVGDVHPNFPPAPEHTPALVL